jgi:hypothetical protein
LAHHTLMDSYDSYPKMTINPMFFLMVDRTKP